MKIKYLIILLSSLFLISCGGAEDSNKKGPQDAPIGGKKKETRETTSESEEPKKQSRQERPTNLGQKKELGKKGPEPREPIKGPGPNKLPKGPSLTAEKGSSLIQRLQKGYSGNYDEIIKKALADGEDLSEKDRDGRNVLHFLLSTYSKPNAQLVKAIAIKAGPQAINETWNDLGTKKTPLFVLAEHPDHLTYDILEPLIKSGADLSDADYLLFKILEGYSRPQDYEKSVALILKKSPNLLKSKPKFGSKTPLELLVGDGSYLNKGALTANLYTELVSEDATQALKQIHEALRNMPAYEKLKGRSEFNAVPPDYIATLSDGTTYKLFDMNAKERKEFEAFKEIDKTKPNTDLIKNIIEKFSEKAEKLEKFLEDKRSQHAQRKSSGSGAQKPKDTQTKPTIPRVPDLPKPVPTSPKPMLPTTAITPQPAAMIVSVGPLPPGCRPEIISEYPKLENDWNALNGTLATVNAALNFIIKIKPLRDKADTAFSNYSEKTEPKFPEISDLDLDTPEELQRVLDKFNEDSVQHQKRKNDIKKDCLDLLEVPGQKVSAHFDLIK